MRSTCIASLQYIYSYLKKIIKLKFKKCKILNIREQKAGNETLKAYWDNKGELRNQKNRL